METQTISELQASWLFGDRQDYEHISVPLSEAYIEIYKCPSSLGCGYRKQLQIEDDITLQILDYAWHHQASIEFPCMENYLAFEYCLTGPRAGTVVLDAHFGLKDFSIEPAETQILKLIIFVKASSFSKYLQHFIDCLPSPIHELSKDIVVAATRYMTSRSVPSYAVALAQLAQRNFPPASSERLPFEQVVSEKLYTKFAALDLARRSPISPAMEQSIARILNCPYSARTRREYMRQRTSELFAQSFESFFQMNSSRLLSSADLDGIFRAEALLRSHLDYPPSIQQLGQAVSLNRLKLNQGFHQVYGTTPFGYLRMCRMRKARYLLMNSELPIEEIAQRVGYSSRSRFATAFRKHFGLNPKRFQLQALNRLPVGKMRLGRKTTGAEFTNGI